MGSTPPLVSEYFQVDWMSVDEDPGAARPKGRSLAETARGNRQAAAELLPLVYTELRLLARARLARERPGATLQPTALVHDAYLRLVGSGDPGWGGEGHFFAAAAEAMRRILVERARRARRQKRGGSWQRVTLCEEEVSAPASGVDVLALDEALVRLAARDPRMAAVAELRYFAGLSVDEAATALGTSRRSTHRLWTAARAWLYRELTSDGGPPRPQER